MNCFAKNENEECTALIETKCHKCKFYRTDLKREEIEKDIKKYSGGKKE